MRDHVDSLPSYPQLPPARLVCEAGAETVTYLLVTMALSSERVSVIFEARQLNPDWRIIVPSRYVGDHDLALGGADLAMFEEAEEIIAMGRSVIEGVGCLAEEFEQEITEIRPEATVA